MAHAWRASRNCGKNFAHHSLTRHDQREQSIDRLAVCHGEPNSIEIENAARPLAMT